jgi:hypothetical protein
MRRLFQDEPVDRFDIPQPARPKAVRDAEAAFKRVACEYAEVKGKIAEATRQRQHEVGKAHAAAATARVAATRPPAKTVEKVEAEFDAKLTALLAERSVLETALDQAGDEMVKAIGAHQAEWLAALEKADEKAGARLSALLDQVDEALEELAAARHAPAWVEEFKLGEALARSSGQTQYPGAPNSLGSTGKLRLLLDPEPVLVGYSDGQPVWEKRMPGRPAKVRRVGEARA